MNTKLTSTLTILSCGFTLLVLVIILVGPGPAILFAGISTLALAGWLWADEPTAGTSQQVLTPFLLVPPVLLALNSARYAGGWIELLETHYAAWFDPVFTFSGTNWFVMQVCAPVTLILFGGYLISVNQQPGRYLTWWAALYCTAEGLMQLTIGFAGGADLYALISALFALGLLGLAVMIVQCLLTSKASANALTSAPMTTRQRSLWAVLFVATVAIYGVALFDQAGPLPVAIIVGSMTLGMIGWWITTSRIPADPSWSVPLLLLLLTFFYIHVGEEVLTDFNGMISEISGKQWDDYDFMLLIGLLGPIVWFFAAWSLWKRQAIGNFILWFLIVGMILGEPTHLLVFPILRMVELGIGYEYASGMYTALFPMIPAIVALVKIVSEHRIRSGTV